MPDPLADRLTALLAEADRLDREADEALDRGDRAAALLLSQRALGRRYLVEELQGEAAERTIRSMNVDTRGQSAAVKRGAGRSTRKHPAQKRLYQKGVTISALAVVLKETRARVSSWFAAGDANRPIPRHHAETLRDRYGIPLGDWSRIAD